jgi:hypothetical protein
VTAHQNDVDAECPAAPLYAGTGLQGKLFYLEPELLVPPAPGALEVPPVEPEDPPIEPAPLELEPDVPLAPELVSPARRSQPTAVMLSAARTSKIFDVVLIAFILIPFEKN